MSQCGSNLHLIISDVEHYFIAIVILSPREIFKCTAHFFFYQIFVFAFFLRLGFWVLLWDIWSSLNILDINFVRCIVQKYVPSV